MTNLKKITKITQNPEMHWVGNGFPVHNLMSYNADGTAISPFLLLDYAPPTHFSPSNLPRGVGQHPHRGFETVTIVYQGELEHKDNAGHSGILGPGDVQWMTAAKGILHEEMHSQNFSKSGGILEMVQLWVNLPKQFKMSLPHYQEIPSTKIPSIKLTEQNVLRVIAGCYANIQGAAKTFTPVNLWNLNLKARFNFEMGEFHPGHNTMLLVLKGDLLINHETLVKSKQLVFFEKENQFIALSALTDCTILVLNGQPIDEPVVGQGPFVMNSKQEIIQAYEDYHSGQF